MRKGTFYFGSVLVAAKAKQTHYPLFRSVQI